MIHDRYFADEATDLNKAGLPGLGETGSEPLGRDDAFVMRATLWSVKVLQILLVSLNVLFFVYVTDPGHPRPAGWTLRAVLMGVGMGTLQVIFLVAIIAVIAGAVMIPTAFLIRRPPALAMPETSVADDGPRQDMTVGEAVRSPQFIILMLANFFCCATHSGPIFHTVSYAVTCGVPMIAAVSIYSIEGLAGLGGRIAFGLMGDRFGAKRVLVSGLLLQAFGVLAYVFVSQLGAFYAVAALVGFVYAGVMPLYAVIVRENFPLKMMGTIIGGTAMAGSLGMSTGPLLGGLIFDAYASYSWLYIASWGMGLAAFLIAMTFRPFAKEARGMVPAAA